MRALTAGAGSDVDGTFNSLLAEADKISFLSSDETTNNQLSLYPDKLTLTNLNTATTSKMLYYNDGTGEITQGAAPSGGGTDTNFANTNLTLTADRDHIIPIGMYLDIYTPGYTSELYLRDGGASLAATNSDGTQNAGMGVGPASANISSSGTSGYNQDFIMDANAGTFTSKLEGGGAHSRLILTINDINYQKQDVPSTSVRIRDLVNLTYHGYSPATGDGSTYSTGEQYGSAIKTTITGASSINTVASRLVTRITATDYTSLWQTSQFEIEVAKENVTARQLALAGDGVLTLDRYASSVSGTVAYNLGVDSTGKVITTALGGGGGVTSVAASISGALSVAGSPITSSGTLAFTWTGSSSQYVRGDGTLASFPTIPALSSITLNTPSVVYSTPTTFTNTSGAWSGTLSLITQTANTVFAGPATGSAATPTFRALVPADIPDLLAIYQGKLTLTTTGTSGASTLVGNTLNIPQYSGGTQLLDQEHHYPLSYSKGGPSPGKSFRYYSQCSSPYQRW
jgi:hypothetical protein